MNKATFPLKLPASLKREAARIARQDGVSLNQWIATAVAQKIGVVQTAVEFLRRRAGGATGDELSSVLSDVPNRPPEVGDELPAGWKQP